MALVVGNLVTFPSAPGIGRVAEIEDAEVSVEFFESAAEPSAQTFLRGSADVHRVSLGEQTRVFVLDRNDRWRAGRVVGGGPDTYFVRMPNFRGDVDIAESRLRVRWEKPPRDPLQVLLSGANETPRFRDVREPVRRLLIAERAATASATGIMSSGVRMHAHQINAALQIIRDPVQRYLLADEVGMGKTIQAGLVIRQILHDLPGRRVGVLAPDALVGQWRAELREKFHLSDFPTEAGEYPVRILGHSHVEEWGSFSDLDLLVVDEAHLLARTTGPDESPYRELAAIAHAAPRLLMLSATPFSRGPLTHLALLHLLDPALFRWEDLGSFERLLENRHALALAVFGLDEDPDVDNPELLQLQFDQIRENLPADEVLQAAINRAMAAYGPDGTAPEDVDAAELRLAVAAVRAHVSETYRLHQRVIRNRRHVVEKQSLDDEGMLTPFEFTGRSRPKVARSDDDEIQAGAAAVAAWASRCTDAVLDVGIDPLTYGRALAVLVSRLGGSIDDVCAVLEHRLGGDASSAALLLAETEVLDAAPVLPFEAEVLGNARNAIGGRAVHVLADMIARRTPPMRKAVVFCGRGSLAAGLAAALCTDDRVKYAHTHVASQTDDEREDAVAAWLVSGGVLVVDDTGDVGRNFQQADLAFHLRLPANPNVLEQRIGRIDRYGHESTAQQYVIADDDGDGITSAWLGALVRAFGIFDTSISALQEVVDDLTDIAWTGLLRDGVEALVDMQESIAVDLAKEKRRINELDALELSYGGNESGQKLAKAIAEYEADAVGIERAFRGLIEGGEGFRFVSKPNKDGSIHFHHSESDKPLLSARLLGRLLNVEYARTGYFDRWRLVPGRALFRRGNPFVDGLEDLLNLDDRGQAVAMWRLDRAWPHDPLAFFGFDFLIEANVEPILAVLGRDREAVPIARRRADAAFPPQHQRIWVPITNKKPVTDVRLIAYLGEPLLKNRDVNLNSSRIPALHTLVGGGQQLASVAEACLGAARTRVDQVADVVEASKRATKQVALETEVLLARSGARAMASSLVTDPEAMEAEVKLSHAIEDGVTSPVVGLTGVSVVVLSAQSYTDYV
ncbi:protein DpdE [Kribbella catacumbae]|uniref:protein DpdE n=1 Tax=Kribbella catacumbae TaxID=460086 RepID=UPI00039B501B|nr:protein DpdE [Kribbella catacumbae]